jgi:hypothetical protein
MLGPATAAGEACGSGGEDLHQGEEFLVAARVSTDQILLARISYKI